MVLVSILSFFLTPLRWVREIIYSQSLRRKAVQIMIACAVLVLLITVSFFAYLSFYWVYIPQRGHIGRVHLQYDKISPSGLPIAPSAVVDFAEGGRYGQTLRSDQAYDISMKLVMPTSSTNVAIGNFMVMVQLIGVNGSVIISSCRPAIITYESFILRILRTIWRAIPLVLRWTQESQTIWLPLLEKFVESSSNPVTKVFIEVSNPDLQIYRTTLHIDAHFQGLRYFMYYYKISTALIFMTAFVFWEITFCILTWQTISSWIINPDSQALAAISHPILHSSHGNLPPLTYHDQPQPQRHPHYLYNSEVDDNDTVDLQQKSSSEEDEDSGDAITLAKKLTVIKNNSSSERQRSRVSLMPKRESTRINQDIDSSASDADSISDATVPQQNQHFSKTSSFAPVSSGQLRIRRS